MAKRASLLIAVALTSLAFWFLTITWAANPVTALTDVTGWVGVLLALILMVSVYALALMLIPELSLRILAIFLVSVPALVFFNFQWLVLAAFALLVVMNLEAIRVIRSELADRMRVNVRGILGHPISIILTSLIILVSTVYYVSPTVQKSTEAKELPPTLTEMIQEVTRRVFSHEFSLVPAKERPYVENQVIKQVIAQFNTTAGPYLHYLPFALTAGLFLLLISLKFIFAWMTTGVTLGLFFILRKSGFVTIAERPVTAEQIVI